MTEAKAKLDRSLDVTSTPTGVDANCYATFYWAITRFV